MLTKLDFQLQILSSILYLVWMRPLRRILSSLHVLVEQDIKDTNDNLVPPWLMHDKLRAGTIVVVDTTLVCWHILPTRTSSRGRNVRVSNLSSYIINNYCRFTKSKHTAYKSSMNQMSQWRKSEFLPYPANSNHKH
jgi:hypothetical protein